MSFPNRCAGHWAFTTILQLDRLEPGLAGDMFRASATRRQVTCAVLAPLDLASLDDKGRGELARRFRFAKTKTLICDTFGSNPAGFTDCLGKMGDCYEGPAFYPALHRLYGDPAAGAVRRRLDRKRVFDISFQLVVLPDLVQLPELGEAFLHRQLVAKIGCPWRTSDIGRVSRLSRRFAPQLSDEQLVATLVSADPSRPIETVLAPFLRKLSLAPQDALAAHPQFELLTTPKQLRRAAREFENCLADRFYERLVRKKQDLVLVWRGNEPAVLHLTRRFGLWGIQDLKGPKNRSLSRKTTATLTGILEPLGIVGPGPA